MTARVGLELIAYCWGGYRAENVMYKYKRGLDHFPLEKVPPICWKEPTLPPKNGNIHSFFYDVTLPWWIGKLLLMFKQCYLWFDMITIGIQIKLLTRKSL